MSVTAAPAGQRSLAVWLMSAYIVALLALPVDVGVPVGDVVLTPARLVLMLAVAVALVQWRSVLAALRRVPWLIWAGWVTFLGASLVTAVAVPSLASWGRFGSMVAEGVVVFALVCTAASSENGLRSLVAVFGATMVAVALAALGFAALGLRYDSVVSGLAGSVPADVNLPRFGLARQFGPFRGAVYFGIWLAVAAAVLLPAMDRAKGAARWAAIAAWVVVVVAAIALTGSRMAMTMVFLLPGAYFLLRGQRLPGVASLVAAGIVVVGVSYLPSGDALIDNSTSLRLTAIGASARAIGEHLWFGWGLLNDMAALGGIIGHRNFVDNTYLSIAIETGIIGLGAFGVLIAGILGALWRGRKSALGLALALAVGAVLAMGLLASVLQVTQGYAAFFVLAALAVAAARPRQSESSVQVEQRL